MSDPGVPISPVGAYRIQVRGQLTQRFASSFDGMHIEPGADTSALTGPLRDQSHLMGVLRAIDALGIELISVVPEPGVR
jgi:hypothetical protein